MKKILASLTLSLIFLCSCSKEDNIISEAKKNLPAILNSEMQYYMGTVEEPEIIDCMAIYSCDSLCVLQCRASAKDGQGEVRSETIRYIFVKDNFMSACNGKNTYCHKIMGAPYLDKEGIAEFCKRTEEHAQELYLYYISSSEPVTPEE